VKAELAFTLFHHLSIIN